METIKVKDWMARLDECATVSEDTTLYEALLALEVVEGRLDKATTRRPTVIVLEKDGRVTGILSHLDILRCLEPKYAEMGDLKKIAGYGLSADLLRSMIDRFGLWKAPLNEICRKASRMRIVEITSLPSAREFIETESSVNQAVHQLILGQDQSLMVTSKGEIVGILFLADVFHKVGERIKACKA